MRVGPAWIEVKGELAVDSERHRYQSPSCYYPRLLDRGKNTFEWQIIQVFGFSTLRLQRNSHHSGVSRPQHLHRQHHSSGPV